MSHSSEAKYSPWTDQACIEAFLEKYKSQFLDFAYEFHQEEIATQEEFKNDCREDR